MPTARTASPQVTTLRLGDVEITRVIEFSDTSPMTTDVFFPGSTPEEWRRHAALLDPDHWDARTDLTRVATQSWVLRSEGRVVVIDTGAGNGKYRPLQPIWSYLDTGYLAGLAAAGVRPEDSTSSSTPICTTTTSAGTPASTAATGCPPSPTPRI